MMLLPLPPLVFLTVVANCAREGPSLQHGEEMCHSQL